jgi:glycosyltransferase involved in cell wall biosynthesis
MLTLTIVIPVYNEEHHIKDCLDSIAMQSVMPAEVIVVDNNCTDNTIDIAKTYDFVKVVVEKKQGRGYARTAGFNAATSQLLARIDADSRLQEDWVKRVTNHFATDESLYGVTGIGKTTFLPGIHSVRTTLFSRAYYWFVHAGFRTITMWGANMAIRKSAWDAVEDAVCLDDSIVHEDQDLSLWIAAQNMNIKQMNNLIISTSGHTYRYLPKLFAYSRLFQSTKRLHENNGNLSKTRTLSYPTLLPGMIGAALLSAPLFLVSIVLFPLDYALLHSKYRKKWLS